MQFGQFKILLEFKEPVRLFYWEQLVDIIMHPKNQEYTIDRFEEYTNDIYRCMYIIITPCMDINEEYIKKPLLKLLKKINSERNIRDFKYNSPYNDEVHFYDVDVTVSKVF